MELLQSPEFWVAVAFVIFATFAVVRLRKPLLDALDQRAARIRDELEEAKRLREEAQHLLAEHKRKQRAAEQETAEILAAARAEAKRISEQAGFELEAALKRREAQARERIARAEAEALAAVRGQAVDLAVDAARRLLAEHLDASKAEALVAEAIKDLPHKLRH